jgi:hypothetical protein
LGAALYLRKVVINPKIRLAHEYCLEKETAKYPFTRVDMKPISVVKVLPNFLKKIYVREQFLLEYYLV